jgi:hypothetical protein
MKPVLIIKTYIWLYDIIHRLGPLTLKEINEAWMKETRLSDGIPMIRQTFSRYRNDIEELFGVSIACDGEHRYFIEGAQQKEADERASLLSSAEKDTLAESMQFYHRIILEPKLSVNIFFSIIVEAMRKNVMTEIDYQQDDDTIVFHQQVEPYYVRQHQGNWRLIGRKHDGSFGSYSLTRIREIRLTDLKFQLDYDSCVKLCERIADFS